MPTIINECSLTTGLYINVILQLYDNSQSPLWVKSGLQDYNEGWLNTEVLHSGVPMWN